jgi:hypothetical protein
MNNSHDEIKQLLEASRKLLNNETLNEDIRKQYGLLTEQGVDLTDNNVTSKINVELGTGIIGRFGGLKYHINGDKNDKNWTPYIGLYLTHMPSKQLFYFGSPTEEKSFLYFPLGIQLNKNKGLTFGAEIAGTTNEKLFWGALKFGYHF